MTTDTMKLRDISGALAGYVAENNGTFPNQFDPIPGTRTSSSSPDRWNFHEAVDRYLGQEVKDYNPNSVYNHLRRVDSPFFSPRAARPYPGFKPSYPEQAGPLAFSFNPNINNESNWRGRLNRIPQPSAIVIMAETNHAGGSMWPDKPAVFASDVECRYRVSRPENSGLYLFADFHIETLKGDRGYGYYSSRPEEPNIWKWW
jgi:hypothetical protein